MTRATAASESQPDDTVPYVYPSRTEHAGLGKPPREAIAEASAEPGVFRALVILSAPILAENVLHMLVGLTDTYLAGHLPTNSPAATAAVGTVAYILWFVNLIAMAIATGATAIVSRAVGAKHRSLANSVAAQSVGAAVVLGCIAGLIFAACAPQLAIFTQLTGTAFDFARDYFLLLSLALPFSIVTVAASAVLRGAGDTVSPAAAMVIVDLVNIVVSLVLARGYFGFPQMGFHGIAIGTIVGYIIGGIILVIVLSRGKRVRLHRHRLRPHWQTLRRLIKIGLPNGVEGGLTWVANFIVLRTINGLDKTNVSGAAHIVTIRVESLSFMIGVAIATATATIVGQSLGQKNPGRAIRATWTAIGLGVAIMGTWGVAFWLAGDRLARAMTSDPAAVDLAAQCLAVTAFSQIGFAVTLIAGGALRGAGDTLIVMLINIISQVGLRLVGALVLVEVFQLGLVAVWVVLAAELSIRGAAILGRFMQGGWKHINV